MVHPKPLRSLRNNTEGIRVFVETIVKLSDKYAGQLFLCSAQTFPKFKTLEKVAQAFTLQGSQLNKRHVKQDASPLTQKYSTVQSKERSWKSSLAIKLHSFATASALKGRITRDGFILKTLRSLGFSFLALFTRKFLFQFPTLSNNSTSSITQIAPRSVDHRPYWEGLLSALG